jgi:hypothetical protein
MIYWRFKLDEAQGRAIAQALSRRIPTAADRVQAPFQTHYFSENLVSPEKVPSPLDL